MRDPPDRDALLALHERLLRGDRVAAQELSCLLLPSLQEELRPKFPKVDAHVVADGVIDAVFGYCTNPQQFDTSRNVPLDRFLCDAAWRNVANSLRGEKRRKQRERTVGMQKREADVAFDPVAGNIQREQLQELDKKRAAMLEALKNPRDKEIWSAQLDGSAHAVFARILAITHLPLDQQRKKVKRHKDRIARFLRRKGLLP